MQSSVPTKIWCTLECSFELSSEHSKKNITWNALSINHSHLACGVTSSPFVHSHRTVRGGAVFNLHVRKCFGPSLASAPGALIDGWEHLDAFSNILLHKGHPQDTGRVFLLSRSGKVGNSNWPRRQRKESETNHLANHNNHNVCEPEDNNGDAHDSVMDNVLLRQRSFADNFQ